MKRRTRDQFVTSILTEISLDVNNAARRKALADIGLNLMTEWKDVKKKEIETKIVTAGGVWTAVRVEKVNG